ncbi:HotDog domain-containing protein [Cubamyces menziesii]|nr:HotDog domain-containing protein [Cubamyces menziesii]
MPSGPSKANFSSKLATSRAWVDPAALPDYLDPRAVSGNASDEVKRLTLNTLGAYGVGSTDSFAHAVGAQIRVTEISSDRRDGRVEVVVVAEVQACKEMLNGAGTVHGGCICYLIDNCASIPLVALGLMQDINGVGVSQAMSVLFHAPASIDTCMLVTSRTVTLGGRIMSARCEITDKQSGRMIASGMLAKMQPNAALPPPRL